MIEALSKGLRRRGAVAYRIKPTLKRKGHGNQEDSGSRNQG